MKIARRMATAITLTALTVLTSVLPAQAASTLQIWSTSSSSQWVAAVLDPKVAINGNVQAVAWISRTSSDSHNLNVRVSRDGTWGAVETLTNSEWDWWNAFDVQITNSGKVYVGYSSGDVNLTVYVSSVANTWTNSVVDSSFSGLGAVKMSGVTNGSVVTFTTNRAVNNREITLSSHTFDETNSGAGWTNNAVRPFTRSDFSACTIRSSYYDSCAVNLDHTQIAIAQDGSQVLFVIGNRISSSGNPPGMQFRLFKFHRSSPTSEWVFGGASTTLTLGKSDSGYSFFLSKIATTPSGKYAAALVTGTTTTPNRLRLFTGSTFASTPTLTDTSALAKFRNTELPTLVAVGEDIYTSFDANQGTHKFGKVGSLASTIKTMTGVKSTQDVKNLLHVNGKIVAVINSPRTATYISTCTLTASVCSWSSAAKVLSYAQYNSFSDGPAATDGTKYLIVQPKLSKFRQIALYSYSN